MKLGNFARLDPSYPGKGLDAGSKLDEAVWTKFADDRARLIRLAARLRDAVEVLTDEDLARPLDDEEAYPEGKVLYRLHRRYERSRALVEQAKRKHMERLGLLSCQLCDFDFQKAYGPIGQGYIEAHHVKPVADMQPGDTTKIKDLLLVCSNCHRMLHRSGGGSTILEPRRR